MAFGMLSLHMAQHILIMNVIVPPLTALAARQLPNTRLWRSWPLATLVQLGLIWGWHSPPVFSGAMDQPLSMALMHGSLTAAAAWFWFAVFSTPKVRLWQAMIALLLTGKLFCFLGALLAFAPNLVYGGIHAAHMSIADQQLAGTLMLVACPLTYVGAGIFLAVRWFDAIDSQATVDG